MKTAKPKNLKKFTASLQVWANIAVSLDFRGHFVCGNDEPEKTGKKFNTRRGKNPQVFNCDFLYTQSTSKIPVVVAII